jgi:hypothetical protein
MPSGIVGQWGLPPDTLGVIAAASGLALIVFRRSAWRWTEKVNARHRTRAIAAVAVFAALASLGYYHFYLRGGPRIIDGTYYWLQAKCFAKGLVSIPLLEPSAALRGRFLHYAHDSGRLSVLFPPGYAAALALGMVLKVPWLVGPLTALLLVIGTAALAKRAFDDSRAALAAGVFSAICATLRYHTADTLSHGWSALLFVTATWSALGQRRRDDVVCGLCCGWLWATRPVSALALFIVILALRWRKATLASWMRWLLAIVPGVAAWLVYQRLTTGSWLQTTQFAYYSLSDGPIGCFRYGFGQGIGCHYEHGGYVAKRLPQSYGLLSALTVTGVRLRWHLLDVTNFEPLMLLLVVAVRSSNNKAAARVFLLAPLLLLLVYAPFYFDGNFPGGGARLLADALPLEHALLGGWVVQRGRFIPVLALSLLGFASHGIFEHRQLSNREGGHPMFEARMLRDAGIQHGLILVNTDHGFGIGHEPGARDANHGLVVARAHHDAHDWTLWKSLGQPATYYYDYNAQRPDSPPAIASVTFSQNSDLKFEAEAEWPVLNIRDAWAIPGFPPCACVSQKRALIVHPSGPRPAVDLALEVETSGWYRVRIGWITLEAAPTRYEVNLDGYRWTLHTGSGQYRCEAQSGPPMFIAKGEHSLRLSPSASALGIDWVQLEPAK